MKKQKQLPAKPAKPVILPSKPSALITLALRDLVACENDSDYTIDMTMWHRPDNGTCSVCLAGSVLAKTFKAEANDYTSPAQLVGRGAITSDTYSKLLALDYFRRGKIKAALEYLGLEKEIRLNQPVAYVTPYSESRELFREAMKDLANKFEAIGY